MKSNFKLRVNEAADSLPALPAAQVGIVLGSGLSNFVDEVDGKRIAYHDIKGFANPSVAGHRGELVVCDGLAVLAGRFHTYEGLSLDDVVLPVFLLAELGVQTLILTNAAGAINRDYTPGNLVLIRDHINLIGQNPLSGPHREDYGPRFPDMSDVYTGSLRARIQTEVDPSLKAGVYAALSGPSYETPAEIRMLDRLGADMVGMSTVPEAIAASFLKLKVIGISCISNMASGILDTPLTHLEVVETGQRAAAAFARLLKDVLRLLEINLT